MAYDLLTKRQSSRDWSCSVGLDVAPSTASPKPTKKWLWLVAAGGIASGMGFTTRPKTRVTSKPLFVGGLAVGIYGIYKDGLDRLQK